MCTHMEIARSGNVHGRPPRRLLAHDPPPLILLPSLLHRQNPLPERPPDWTQPVRVVGVLGRLDDDTPIEPDLMHGDDDRGRADAEDLREGACGGPAFEVGQGEGAFGGVDRLRSCGSGGRGDGRAKGRV